MSTCGGMDYSDVVSAVIFANIISGLAIFGLVQILKQDTEADWGYFAVVAMAFFFMFAPNITEFLWPQPDEQVLQQEGALEGLKPAMFERTH